MITHIDHPVGHKPVLYEGPVKDPPRGWTGAQIKAIKHLTAWLQERAKQQDEHAAAAIQRIHESGLTPELQTALEEWMREETAG